MLGKMLERRFFICTKEITPWIFRMNKRTPSVSFPVVIITVVSNAFPGIARGPEVKQP